MLLGTQPRTRRLSTGKCKRKPRNRHGKKTTPIKFEQSNPDDHQIQLENEEKNAAATRTGELRRGSFEEVHIDKSDLSRGFSQNDTVRDCSESFEGLVFTNSSALNCAGEMRTNDQYVESETDNDYVRGDRRGSRGGRSDAGKDVQGMRSTGARREQFVRISSHVNENRRNHETVVKSVGVIKRGSPGMRSRRAEGRVTVGGRERRVAPRNAYNASREFDNSLTSQDSGRPRNARSPSDVRKEEQDTEEDRYRDAKKDKQRSWADQCEEEEEVALGARVGGMIRLPVGVSTVTSAQSDNQSVPPVALLPSPRAFIESIADQPDVQTVHGRVRVQGKDPQGSSEHRPGGSRDQSSSRGRASTHRTLWDPSKPAPPRETAPVSSSPKQLLFLEHIDAGQSIASDVNYSRLGTRNRLDSEPDSNSHIRPRVMSPRDHHRLHDSHYEYPTQWKPPHSSNDYSPSSNDRRAMPNIVNHPDHPPSMSHASYPYHTVFISPATHASINSYHYGYPPGPVPFHGGEFMEDAYRPGYEPLVQSSVGSQVASSTNKVSSALAVRVAALMHEAGFVETQMLNLLSRQLQGPESVSHLLQLRLTITVYL